MRSTPLKNTNPFNKDFLRQQLVTYIAATFKDVADTYFSVFNNFGDPANNALFNYHFVVTGSPIVARINAISEAPLGDNGQVSVTIILQHQDGSYCEGTVKNSQFFFGTPNQGLYTVEDFALFLKEMKTDADTLVALPTPNLLIAKV